MSPYILDLEHNTEHLLGGASANDILGTRLIESRSVVHILLALTMSLEPWLEHDHLIANNLPLYCTPTNPFFTWLSSTFNTCIPNPLAFVSTLFGCLSILAWLFAQLPQLYKNYHLQSTSGLSLFFLVEWCIGDISNLAGAILTQQATWQIFIGAYYCFVDSSLVAQYIWYQKLKHGRPIRRFWKRKHTQAKKPDTTQVDNGVVTSGEQAGKVPNGKQDKPKPKTIPVRGINFRTPNYGSIQSFKERWSAGSSNSPISPRMQRVRQTDTLPAPSPKTILFITLLIALAKASPLPAVDGTAVSLHTLGESDDAAQPSPSTLMQIGTVLSWFSALLYLFSRLPQLIKNHSRRSTAGLSLTLFVAAFFGNFFYSASLVLNPLAWSDYPPYGGDGWASEDGSERLAYILNTLPFFLGSAGVLVMDAAVAVQFWWFKTEPAEGGSGDSGGEEVLVVDAGPSAAKPETWRWLEVTGWMRGWKPSVSGITTPVLQDRNDSAIGSEGTNRAGEQESLLPAEHS